MEDKNKMESIESIVKEIEKECRGIFKKHKEIDGAHTWDHTERVRNIALKIVILYNKGKREEEKVNIYEIEIIALLHDIGQYQEENHAEQSYKLAKTILEKHRDKLINIDTERILKIVRSHPYPEKKDCIDKDIYEDIWFKIITDADKIDSFGPIGIMRSPLDERFNSIKKQVKHIREKADPKGFSLRTVEGEKVGQGYKDYLIGFLEEYDKQVVETE